MTTFGPHDLAHGLHVKYNMNHDARGRFARTAGAGVPQSKDLAQIISRRQMEIGYIVRSKGGTAETARLVESMANRALADITKDSELTIRVPPSIVTKVLDQGVKNMAETRHGTPMGSGTSINEAVSQRNAFEKDAFGIEDPNPKAHPVYGYFRVKPDGPFGGEQDMADQYGSVRIVLKESVKQRTTVSVGDAEVMSYNYSTHIAPSPATKPHIGAMTSQHAVWLATADKPISWLSMVVNRIPYIEAHVHGGVAPSDIAKIIYEPSYVGGKPSAGVAKKLKALGIPYEVEERPGIPQEALAALGLGG